MPPTNSFIVLIFGFLFFGTISETKKHGCNKILGEVADAQMHFTGCMVEHSSPAASCISCFANHSRMIELYSKLTLNATCAKEILNKNRLNIVYNMQKYLVDVWNKGFCDDCFTNNVSSNDTQHYKSLSDDFQKCIANPHKPLTICEACGGQYADLNNFYKQMDAEKKGQICFDTQDDMNRTRSLWSKDLNCCQREINFTLFFIASSMFGVLPIIFYSGMYFYTKRMERNHDTLDDGLNSRQASTSTGVSSGMLSHGGENSAPNRRNSSSSSEDEEIDALKKQRNVSSSHEKPVNSVKKVSYATPTATSSNQVESLIEL